MHTAPEEVVPTARAAVPSVDSGRTDAPRSDPVPAPIPGEALLHPVCLFLIGLLILNDHVLKPAWPGWWTGKLSDFAGLGFFPLFLQGLWELGQSAIRGRRWRPSAAVLVVAVSVTVVWFAAVKLFAPATDIQAWLGGIGWWLASMPGAIASGSPAPVVVPSTIARDPTDIVALPAVVVALVLGLRRLRARQ